MNKTLRNIIGVVLGIVTGMIVNMSLIKIFGYLIPLPEGVDTSTVEGLNAAMPLFEPVHFISPFVAHAGGTLAGALVAAAIAVSHKMKFAIAIACFFLVGGIMMIVQVPSPLWFNIVDLVGAYIPMGFLAGRMVSK